jgi:hypothetical protein
MDAWARSLNVSSVSRTIPADRPESPGARITSDERAGGARCTRRDQVLRAVVDVALHPTALGVWVATMRFREAGSRPRKGISSSRSASSAVGTLQHQPGLAGDVVEQPEVGGETARRATVEP